MATPRIALTYRDYEAMPPDGKRYELHEGDLWVTPAPTTRHQKIVGSLYALLLGHVRARSLGEVLVSAVGNAPVTAPPFPDLGFAPASRVA